VSTARLESLGGGRFRVSGTLDASTVAGVLEQSAGRFGDAQHLYVDLGGVSESDSSGLALLIEWLRLARQQGRTIHFANVPPQINALARISEVEDLLNANGAAPVKAAAAAATA
jgi:phospholipid transport system transporter-binding protein